MDEGGLTENELGAVGVDHELLLREAQPEEVVLLSNGCVCCCVRKDLITTLLALRDKLPLLDACLIETTGVADPAALVQTFYAAELRGVCRLDAGTRRRPGTKRRARWSCRTRRSGAICRSAPTCSTAR